MNKRIELASVMFYRQDPCGHGLQVLLQRKDRGWPRSEGNDYWSVWGGKLENSEDAISCLVRETSEELGLERDRDSFTHITDIEIIRTDETVLMPFYVSEFTESLSDIVLKEGCGFAFFYADNLPDGLVPHEEPAIQAAIRQLS